MLQTNLFGGVKWNVDRTETQNCWQISNIVCGRAAKIYFVFKIMVLFLLWKLSCRPPRVVEFKDNVLLRSLSMCTVGEKLKKIKGATSYRQLETENRHKIKSSNFGGIRSEVWCEQYSIQGVFRLAFLSGSFKRQVRICSEHFFFKNDLRLFLQWLTKEICECYTPKVLLSDF